MTRRKRLFNRSIRLSATLLLAISMATMLGACGGGGGSSADTDADVTNEGSPPLLDETESPAPDNGGQPVVDTINLPTTAIVPVARAGQLIVLNDQSVTEGELVPVSIRYLDSNNNSLTTIEAQGFAETDATVLMVAPVAINPEDVDSLIGRTAITVGTNPNATLVHIVDVPELPDTSTSGQIYVGKLKAVLATLDSYIAAMQSYAENGSVAQGAADQLLAAALSGQSRLQQQIEEYETFGTLSFSTDDGVTQTLGPDSLQRLDRITTMTLASQQYYLANYGENTSAITSRYARVPDWDTWWENAARPSIEAIGGDGFPDLTFGVWDATKEGADKARRLMAWVGIQVFVSGPAHAGVALNYVNMGLAYFSGRIKNAFESGSQTAYDQLKPLVEAFAKNGVAILTALPDRSAFTSMINELAELLDAVDLLENIDAVVGAEEPPPPTDLHPCHEDSGVEATAYWLWYRRIFGGGGFRSYEYGGYICWSYTTNYYYEYMGSGLVGYDCDSDWKNCEVDGNGNYPYHETQPGDGGSTRYYYNDGNSWGVRHLVTE